MSFERSRPISTAQTAIKASQWSLEALGSKQPKFRTSNPGGSWLPTMFVESRKLEQRTSPRAATRFPGVITTLVEASVSVPNLLSHFHKKFLPWWGIDSIHIWLSSLLSHIAHIKCFPVACWPTVTQAVALETGCPPLHSCPCPNETLVQNFTLLLCRQKVSWHTD